MIEVKVRPHEIVGAILEASSYKFPPNYKFNITKDDSILEFGNLLQCDIVNKHIEVSDGMFAVVAAVRISAFIHHNSFWENNVSDVTVELGIGDKTYTADKCNMQITDTGIVYISIPNQIIFVL